jgi:sulfite oxidase
MNGQEIPLDHGFPLRLIAPGIVGARNVKWLSRIVLSDEESHSHWQRKDYKSFSPNINWDNVDFESAPSIQELPVQSAICDPIDGKVVDIEGKKSVKLRGYAWSGGGRKIIRVDVSADNGKNWITADLQQEDTPLNRTYSWSLWQVLNPIILLVSKIEVYFANYIQILFEALHKLF